MQLCITRAWTYSTKYCGASTGTETTNNQAPKCQHTQTNSVGQRQSKHLRIKGVETMQLDIYRSIDVCFPKVLIF